MTLAAKSKTEKKNISVNKDCVTILDSEKKRQDFMNSKWRPAAAWIYLLICIVDFIVFPVLWSILQTTHGEVSTIWQPLTLQGGGLMHISFGALLGVTAYGRTREKLAGIQ